MADRTLFEIRIDIAALAPGFAARARKIPDNVLKSLKTKLDWRVEDRPFSLGETVARSAG